MLKDWYLIWLRRWYTPPPSFYKWGKSSLYVQWPSSPMKSSIKSFLHSAISVLARIPQKGAQQFLVTRPTVANVQSVEFFGICICQNCSQLEPFGSSSSSSSSSECLNFIDFPRRKRKSIKFSSIKETAPNLNIQWTCLSVNHKSSQG